jgi:nitroreductase
MTVEEKNDPLQLGQLIRFNAHMLEIATRTKKPDLEKKKEESRELERYLEKWDESGFPETPYIIWARKSLDKFRVWLKDPKFLVNQPKERLQDKPSQDLHRLIRERRTVRFWKKKKVPKKIITEILEAGIYAPSAFNRLPWRFFVAETAIKDLKEGDASNPGMFQQAPVRIFVTVDERLFFEKYSGALDAGLAMQNMLLTAHANALGTCLIYQGEFVDKEILEKYYQIPPYCTVYCAILLGYPDEIPEIPARMSVEEITVYLGEIPNPDI